MSLPSVSTAYSTHVAGGRRQSTFRRPDQLNTSILKEPIPALQRAFASEQGRDAYTTELYQSSLAFRDLAIYLDKKYAGLKDTTRKAREHIKTLKYENERRRRQVSKLQGHDAYDDLPTWGELLKKSLVAACWVAYAGGSFKQAVTWGGSAASNMYPVMLGSFLVAFAFFFVALLLLPETFMRHLWVSANIGGCLGLVFAYFEHHPGAFVLFFLIIWVLVTMLFTYGIFGSKKDKNDDAWDIGLAYRRKSSSLSPLGPSRRYT